MSYNHLTTWQGTSVTVLVLERHAINLGVDSIKRCHLTSIENPTVEIRQSYNCLISTMGFPVLVRQHLCPASGPRVLSYVAGCVQTSLSLIFFCSMSNWCCIRSRSAFILRSSSISPRRTRSASSLFLRAFSSTCCWRASCTGNTQHR